MAEARAAQEKTAAQALKPKQNPKKSAAEPAAAAGQKVTNADLFAPPAPRPAPVISHRDAQLLSPQRPVQGPVPPPGAAQPGQMRINVPKQIQVHVQPVCDIGPSGCPARARARSPRLRCVAPLCHVPCALCPVPPLPPRATEPPTHGSLQPASPTSTASWITEPSASGTRARGAAASGPWQAASESERPQGAAPPETP